MVDCAKGKPGVLSDVSLGDSLVQPGEFESLDVWFEVEFLHGYTLREVEINCNTVLPGRIIALLFWGLRYGALENQLSIPLSYMD